MATFNAESKDIDILNHFADQATGKTFLITGPSPHGIGSQIALTLARASPTHLILAGRSLPKIRPILTQLQTLNPSIRTSFIHLDLLSNASVRKAVQEIQAVTEEIDVLVNNAGVMAVRGFRESEDGVESQFAVNYLGHFLLTNLLIKKGIVGNEGGTIVNLGSLGYQLAEANLEDINFQNGKSYNGWKAYGQAKTALMLFNGHLARKMAGRGTFVVIAHPGVTLESQLLPNSAIDQEYFMEAYKLAIERNGGNPLPPQTTVSLSQAAGVILFASLNSALRATPGVFIVEDEVYKETKEYATNEETAVKLWKISEKLVGEEFPF